MREVQDFLVRIFGTVGDLPSGCGFLVDKDNRHVLTCCHVVNAALGRREISQPSAPVFLDFPFLAPNRPLKAEVERWHYAADDPLHDICVLKLLDDSPSNAQPAPMVRATDYSGDAFRAFGFPKDFESNGREVRGVLGAKQVNGRVLAEGISQFGYFIEGGFSGTPIWNSTRGGVCGMAFQVDTPATLKVASIIPTEQLMQSAGDLIELSGMIPDYLRRLIADLESRRGVLQYVDLSGQTEISFEKRTVDFDIDDEFGFSELVNKPQSPQKETVHLGKIRDVLDKHSCFVLIGDAGSSKTTTIRRLALEAARKYLLDNNAPLPLLFYLPRWESGLTIEEFLNQQCIALGLSFSSDLIALLKSGEVLLYLDGLNEMGRQGVENAKALKSWLSSTDAPQHIIVTCRKDNYIGDFELGIPVVHIELMSDDHIREFVRNYLPKKAEGLLKRILPSDDQAKRDSRHLYHLAKNPYMLAALIVIFDQVTIEELPHNNGKLFQMLTKALAKREVQRNTKGWIPLEIRLPIIEVELAKLAFAMINEERGTEVELSYATQYLDKLTLEAASRSTYIEINNQKVRFYHQLMLEYFSAKYMCENINTISTLVYKPHYIHIQITDAAGDGYAVRQERKGSKWDNTFDNVIGIIEDIESILHELSAIDCLLALKIVLENNIKLNNLTSVILLDKLLDEFNILVNFGIGGSAVKVYGGYYPTINNWYTYSALGYLNDFGAKNRLSNCLADENETVSQLAKKIKSRIEEIRPLSDYFFGERT
jgi:hypothetical protein